VRTQDISQALNSLYIDVSELPPQMRNLPCAVANCQQPTTFLVKVNASGSTLFEPMCGNHGGNFNHARGSIQEAQRQVREQWQHEQDELHAWQQQQNQRQAQAAQQQQPPPAPPGPPANPGDTRICAFGHAHAAGDTTFESCLEVFDKMKEYRDRTFQAARLAANHGMVIGRHYKLTYQEDYPFNQAPNQWPPMSVGGAWVAEFTGETDTQYQLAAGPHSQLSSGSLPKHWVYEILEVPVGHPMFIQKLRGPRRT
jgi:hypothetical protein